MPGAAFGVTQKNASFSSAHILRQSTKHFKSKIVPRSTLDVEYDGRRAQVRAAVPGAPVRGFPPGVFPPPRASNLPLALGGDCVHTFARLKFLLSRVYG
jgi:hypothetical protein